MTVTECKYRYLDMFDSKNWSPQSSVVVPGIAGVVLTLTGAGTVLEGELFGLAAGEGGQGVRVFRSVEHLAVCLSHWFSLCLTRAGPAPHWPA